MATFVSSGGRSHHPHAATSEFVRESMPNWQRYLLPPTGDPCESIWRFLRTQIFTVPDRVDSNRIKPNQTARLVPELPQCPPGDGICDQKKPAHRRAELAAAFASNSTKFRWIQVNRISPPSDQKAPGNLSKAVARDSSKFDQIRLDSTFEVGSGGRQHSSGARLERSDRPTEGCPQGRDGGREQSNQIEERAERDAIGPRKSGARRNSGQSRFNPG